MKLFLYICESRSAQTMKFINESVSSLRRAGLDMKLQISDKLIRPGNALELGLKYLYINNFTKNPSI